MELVLPEGTMTWKNRGSQSTLDIFFLSKEIEDAVTCCQPADELEASSDHILIHTQLSIQSGLEETIVPNRQWKRANWNEVNKTLNAEPVTLSAKYSDLNSRQTIDHGESLITSIIQKVIRDTIPNANPSRFAKPYWTYQCSEAAKETQKARRKCKKSWL